MKLVCAMHDNQWWGRWKSESLGAAGTATHGAEVASELQASSGHDGADCWFMIERGTGVHEY